MQVREQIFPSWPIPHHSAGSSNLFSTLQQRFLQSEQVIRQPSPSPGSKQFSALSKSFKWLQVPPEWTPGSISFSFCAPLSLLYSPFCACPCILLVSQMCRAPFCLKLSHASAMDWQTSPLHCDCALLLVSRVSVQTSLLCCRLLQLSRLPMSIGSYLPILTQLVNIYVLCGC